MEMRSVTVENLINLLVLIATSWVMRSVHLRKCLHKLHSLILPCSESQERKSTEDAKVASGGGNPLCPYSQQRPMRTDLSCCLGLIDNGQYRSTNRLLILEGVGYAAIIIKAVTWVHAALGYECSENTTATPSQMATLRPTQFQCCSQCSYSHMG